MTAAGAVSGMGKWLKCDSKNWARFVVAFGLGMILTCIFPTGLILFLAAVILIALGIALFKC